MNLTSLAQSMLYEHFTSSSTMYTVFQPQLITLICVGMQRNCFDALMHNIAHCIIDMLILTIIIIL